MPQRRQTVSSKSGVKLILIEDLGRADQVINSTYRLTTLRQAQPRLIADPEAAAEAFDLEVISSLSDPTVQRLVAQGW